MAGSGRLESGRVLRSRFSSLKLVLITSSLIAYYTISLHSHGNLCIQVSLRNPLVYKAHAILLCVTEPARGRRSWERQTHPNMHTYTFMFKVTHARLSAPDQKAQISFRSPVLLLFILSSFTRTFIGCATAVQRLLLGAISILLCYRIPPFM